MNRTLTSGPVVWLGIIVTTCLLLALFQTVLWLVVPMLLALVSYYILSPLVDRVIARGFSRQAAVGLVVLVTSLLLLVLAINLTPRLVLLYNNLVKTMPDYVESGIHIVDNIRRTLEMHLPMLHHTAHPEKAQVSTATPGSTTEEILTSEISGLIDTYAGQMALEALHWVPSLLLVPYLTYFLLLDGPRFKRFLMQAIPNAFFERTLYLLYRVEDQLRRYFIGLLALTALDAVCLGVGLFCLGLQEPFALALIAAVLSWLPYLGSLLGGVIMLLVAAHDLPTIPWAPYAVVGLFIGVRLLDDFVFLPLTIGRSLSMHPLLAVLMILLGGAVAGIAGLLLVMPVLGVVMVAGQIVGELITDERVLARYRHARELRRERARADLFSQVSR